MMTRENLKLLVVAVACLLVAWTGPSVAHGVHAKFAHNADKVDGKHAVGAGAGLTKAKGKLVAHNGQGQLPARFIPTVRNSDKVDGLDAGSLVTETEYDKRPGTRLLAAGVVRADGTKDGASDLGAWTVAKGLNTGHYQVFFNNTTLCRNGGLTTPVVLATTLGNPARQTDVGLLSCSPLNGNVGVTIRTRDDTGALVDGSFSFTIFGRGTNTPSVPSS